MGFAENIRTMRKQRGWTQVDLGIKTGINPKTLSSYEQGRTEPSLGEVSKICSVFDCSIAYLTGTKERESGDVSLEDILIKINTMNVDDLKMLRSKIQACIDNREQIMAIMQEKEQLEKQLKEYEEKIKILEGNV